MQNAFLKLEKIFNIFADIIGKIASFVMVLMIANVFYDVIARYFLKSGSIAMQELEWHFFSIIILLGISYTLKEDGHVRVDLIYDKLGKKKKALINILGGFFFIMPIALLIATGSINFVYESYSLNEISGDPGGLTHRWLIKAMIPFSFLLLIITSIGFIIKNINIYKGYDHFEKRNTVENIL